MCKQLTQGRYIVMFWLGLEPATSRLPVRCLNHCRTTPQNVIQRRQKLLWTVAECLQCRLLPQEFTNDRLSERTSIWTYVRDRQWLAEGGGWQSGVGDRLRVSGVRRTLVAAECVVRCQRRAPLHRRRQQKCNRLSGDIAARIQHLRDHRRQWWDDE